MLKKSSPLKHREGEHLILNEKAHEEAHANEENKTIGVNPTTTFSDGNQSFQLDDINQIWFDGDGNIVDDVNIPEKIRKKNKSTLENNTVAENSSIQNAEKFKATPKQIEKALNFADKNIELALEQREKFKIQKNKELGLDANGNKLMITLPSGTKIPATPTQGMPQKPIGYNQLNRNHPIRVRYDENLKAWEDQNKHLKELKRARDTNPMWKYLQDAEHSLRYTTDENGDVIRNPNAKQDVTDENIIKEAKSRYLEDQKRKYLQKNVEEWIDSQDGVGVNMPQTQKDEIAKNEIAIKKLDAQKQKDIKTLNSTAQLYLDVNNQMGLLKNGGIDANGNEVQGFDNRDKYFENEFSKIKDKIAKMGVVDSNSSEATIAKYNNLIEEGKSLTEKYEKYLVNKNNFIKKFEDLERTRDGYKKNYDQLAVKIQEFSENGEDLLAYHNLMKRNGHLLTGAGAWVVASAAEILSGLEADAAEIIMLPQGLRNDKMLGDNPIAQYLVAKADQFEKFRGGQPILDKNGNYIGDTPGYKDKINKFAESLHNQVQLPQLYDDIESLEDFGEFGVNVLANFAPQLALMSVSKGKSLYLLAGSAAGGSLDESRRSNKLGQTDYSLGQRVVHSLMMAGSEYWSEKYTLNLLKGTNKYVKRRVADGFEQAIKKTFTPRNLMAATNRMLGEGVSETNAKLFGENAADIFVYGKRNKSLLEGLDEAFVSGVLMERGIALPGIARRLSMPFIGNQYDSKLRSWEKSKRDIEKALETEGLSEDVKKDLRNKYLDIQQKQDEFIKKHHENVDMMTEDEVGDLIDLDVKLHNIKQAEDNINNDKSLTKAQKEDLIKKNRAEEQDILSQKNKIIHKYEDPETRKKREEEYEKQKEVIKAKIAKFNKRQIKGFTETNASARGKFKEFETVEEQQAFFNEQISEANAKDRAEIQEMRELLENPNITRQDRLTIQNNLAALRKQIDARNKYSKTASSEFGFIGQQADGSFQIYVNKENALSVGGNINVGAHEFLHGVLYQTARGDSKIQKQLGDAVIDYIANEKGGFSQEFIDKMEPYQGDANFGEEVITVMSESILDGSLKYKEGFFTKVGDIIRQTLQRYGLKDIEFNTGKDVYNFIKDYNASIEKNYDSKAIDRMMDTGAQGKLLEGRKGGRDIMQASKAQADKVQDIYAKKGADGAGEIAMEYRGMAEEIFKRNLNLAPSEDIRNNLLDNKEDIIGDILYNPGTETAKARTVLGLVNDFQTKKHKYGNVAAYINQFLPQRAKEIFAPYGVDMAITKSQEQEGIREKVAKIAAEKTAKLSEDSFKGHKIHEKLGQGDPRVRKLVKKYQENVKAIAKKMSIEEVRNLKFKDVEGKGHKIIAEILGIDAAKLDPDNKKQFHANLRYAGTVEDGNETLSAQMVIAKNPLAFKIAIPKHHTTKRVKTNKKDANGDWIYEERPHEAIGIPGSILKPYMIKGKRKGNLTPFTLDKEMMDDKKFLEPIGVIDGKSFREMKGKEQQTILNLATLLDKTMTYQAIKEQKLEEGYTLDDTKTISDGVSEFSFSKAVRKLNPSQTEIFYTKLPELGATVNPALKDYTKVSEMKKALEEVYGKDLPAPVKTAIAKDFVGLIKRYQNVIANNQTIDEGTWTEYIADSFNQEADNIVKMLNLEIDGKKISAASIYDSQQNIERGRRKLIEYGNNLVKQGKSLEEVARIMAILKPMYAGNSKVGRGMFTTDKNGKLQVIEGVEFGTPRNQIFESVPMFEKWGVMQIDGMTPEIWKNANTKLKAQNSKAAIKDRDFDGRLAEAKEARQVIDSMMKFLNKEGNDLDIAMFMISNLSSMDAPLRRAANLQYIADSVLNMEDIGKNAEYEHMIPANYMALKIIDQYKNKGGIKNLDNFYKNYNVAIIPKTMDKVLKLQGLQSKMMPGYNFETDPSTNRYYNFLTNGFDDIVSIRDINSNEIVGPQVQYSKGIKQNKVLSKAMQFSKKKNKPRGITVLDFDDTLATTKSLVKYTTPNGKTGTLNAEQYAATYEDLLDKGYKFDFSEFNKVVKPQLAPLFNKAMKLQKKFGPKNMFVLTARPPAAQKAIFDFLKANGLNIPLKNITGLGNSTSEAKALWIADKVGEGYNDFYFADDALQNVQAVKNMLDQFDVKSKVQQAKLQFSKSSLDSQFNKILEESSGVGREKEFGKAKAQLRGKNKGKFKFFIPYSAEDFNGLMYAILPKGKKGEEAYNFLKKTLIDPYARGYRDLNAAKQTIANDYKALRKAMPDVRKKLTKKIPNKKDFRYADAVRVYLWDKSGFDIPGLSETDRKFLVDLINKDNKLKSYADALSLVSKRPEGYTPPQENWLVTNILGDLQDAVDKVGRKEFLAEWKENKDIIFSPKNLNKLEAVYGTKYREALEDMLFRMENGTNRTNGDNKLVNAFMNWTNNSVGAIMFFNTRSATLQTLSSVNFINWGDNNIAKAAVAFANQPQFWKDFSTLFNSDMLQQRRKGLKTDVNHAELTEAVGRSKNPAMAALNYLLQKGFLPTQIADSFAISSGGATFYRNRINTYLKQGLSQKEAEERAFTDFQEIAEATQQSSRPDFISQQQASALGRLILAFQNTPMQYMRLTKRAMQDLVSGRGDWKTHVSRILYYGAIQNVIFYALQQGLFALAFDDEEDDEKRAAKEEEKMEKIMNGMLDSILRGIGVGGAVASTIKNMIIKIGEEDKKDWNSDFDNVVIEGLQLSPPIGSKVRKARSAGRSYKYNKDVIKNMSVFNIDNPVWDVVGNVISFSTNFPLDRYVNKHRNIKDALDDQNEAWQRVALMLGWNRWGLDMGKPEEVELIKTELKQKKQEQRKQKEKIKKEEKKKEKEKENEAVIEGNKEKSKKDGVCSAISKSGKRCGNSVVPGKLFCTVHEKVEQRASGEKSQCRKIKSDGKRCKMQTSNKSGYCYYHD